MLRDEILPVSEFPLDALPEPGRYICRLLSELGGLISLRVVVLGVVLGRYPEYAERLLPLEEEELGPASLRVTVLTLPLGRYPELVVRLFSLDEAELRRLLVSLEGAFCRSLDTPDWRSEEELESRELADELLESLELRSLASAPTAKVTISKQIPIINSLRMSVASWITKTQFSWMNANLPQGYFAGPDYAG